MTISMSSASLPVFKTMLGNLKHCLQKAEANATARKFDVNVLVAYRLAPDMLPFSAQIRIACDAATAGLARIAGQTPPPAGDNDTTFSALKMRIDQSLAFLDTIPASALDGSEDREITFPVGRDGATRTMRGEDYLKHRVMPNFYFHVTTAYAILRHNGVDLGKNDYLYGAQQ